MIRQLNLNTENYWTIPIKRELNALIYSKRKRCVEYEEDIFQDVIVELLEEYQGNEIEFAQFINLYEKKELTKVIDRVSQEWTRALEKRKRKEKTIDHFEQLIEAGNFETWRLINRALTTHYSLLEAGGQVFTDECLVNFLTTGTLTNIFPLTIYSGTENHSLNGPNEEKNSENVKNKKIPAKPRKKKAAASLRPSKRKRRGDHDLKTLEGVRDFIQENYGSYSLSDIGRSYADGCERYFQFQNFCPVCHKYRQCLSFVERTNGGIFFNCFNDEADERLKELGVKRRTIPQCLEIIAKAEGQF